MNVANPRFPLFDSLRAIAALMVFACHVPMVAQMAFDSPVRRYLIGGSSGVAVFFLVSGFLLYRPFVQSRLAGDPPPALGGYGLRRFLRIVPAYWVALVGAVLLVGASGEGPGATEVFSADGVIRYFGFLQIYDSQTLLGGISAAWTLCIEVAFYTLLPFWALLMRRISFDSTRVFLRTELVGLAALYAIGVGWTAIAAADSDVNPNVFIDVTSLDNMLYLPIGYADHFALGMLLAVASVLVTASPRHPRAVQTLDTYSWVPWLAAAVAFVCLANMGNWLPDRLGLSIVGIHVLQGVFAFGVLLPAVFGDPEHGVVRMVLSNRVLLWVGLVSYGLYLWHVSVNTKLLDLGLDDRVGTAGFVVVALSLTLTVAAASFYGIERHALRLGRRISRRSSSQDADLRVHDLAHHERPDPAAAEHSGS